MKTSESAAQTALNTITHQNPLPSLLSRDIPLAAQDVEKMQAAIGKYFDVQNTDLYGYIPSKADPNKTEYDVVGQATTYLPKGPVPQQMWDAILRPASARHIVDHIGRLAVHLRDTRGAEAFQIFLEDIGRDLAGVSEWAVVMGCMELRRKHSTWFPATNEIIETIRKYGSMFDVLFLSRAQIENRAPAQGKLTAKDYYKNPQENPKRRVLCDFLISKGKPDYFAETRFWSNYDLEREASRLGYGATDGVSSR